MRKKTISKDTPLAEITLRKYESPKSLQGRDLARKFILSLGLLQPGDSRDAIVDVFMSLLEAKKENKAISIEEIQKAAVRIRQQSKLPKDGTALSNIRRQVRRLREAFLAEKIGSSYRITENSHISDIFQEKIEKYLLQAIVSRLKEYAAKIDE